MTSVANAKWPTALGHTIEGRKEVLAVQEGFDFQVQRDCDQVLVIENDPNPPWVRCSVVFFTDDTKRSCNHEGTFT